MTFYHIAIPMSSVVKCSLPELALPDQLECFSLNVIFGEWFITFMYAIIANFGFHGLLTLKVSYRFMKNL